MTPDGVDFSSCLLSTSACCSLGCTVFSLCLQAAKDLPVVQDMLRQANAVLGYDVLQLCLEGPKEKLDDTVYSQPALYVAGLAAVEKLRRDNPEAVNACSATAGKQPYSAHLHNLD